MSCRTGIAVHNACICVPGAPNSIAEFSDRGTSQLHVPWVWSALLFIISIVQRATNLLLHVGATHRSHHLRACTFTLCTDMHVCRRARVYRVCIRLGLD